MDKNLDIQIEEALKAYLASGVEDQVDYQKFYLYYILTHSTAIEGSTVTEIENQLLFDEGFAAKGRSLTEQMMNVDLKDAYLHAFKIVSENLTYTSQFLQQLSALVMLRTGSEYSTIAGQFNSSKGEFRLCNVSAGIGGRSYLAYNKVPQVVEGLSGSTMKLPKLTEKILPLFTVLALKPTSAWLQFTPGSMATDALHAL